MSISLAQILSHPRLFVPYWFKEKNLSVLGSLIIDSEGKSRDLNEIHIVSWLDYAQELKIFNEDRDRASRLRGFPEKDLAKATEEFLIGKKKEALDAAKENIKCTSETLEELQRFLIAATGKSDEVELAALAHLLWQIKRKMFNKKVFFHLMVIFKGRQGVGKTEAIRALFAPVRGWFKSTSLNEIADERWRLFLREGFVVFCDELQFAERTSVDALKNIISAETLETRKLGTNMYMNVTQNCTFVGASNRSVGDLIRDNTGMRRFFEIESLQKMDWETINSIDALKIWRGIDENRSEPYTAPFKKQIATRQEQLVLPDAEEDFLESFKLLEGSQIDRTEFIANSKMYSAFSAFAKQNGERLRASNIFHKRIKGLGMDAYFERQGHQGSKGYRITKVTLDLIEKYLREFVSGF